MAAPKPLTYRRGESDGIRIRIYQLIGSVRSSSYRRCRATKAEAQIGSGVCYIRLLVCDACMPTVQNNTLIAPRSLLLVDAYAGLLGESIAGFLLAKIKTGSSWLRKIAEKYRFRVVAEELYGLALDIDGILAEARLKPLYPAARRASLLGPPYDGLYSSSEQELDEAYADIMKKIGFDDEKQVSPARIRAAMRKAKLRASIVMARASIRLGRVLRGIARVTKRLASSFECPVNWEFQADDYVSLPEGVYIEGRLGLAAGRLLGPGYVCGRVGPLSSSRVCWSDRGKVVVKRYTQMMLKWIPAALASPPRARFVISASGRMAREYQMLRLLRDIIDTPRVYAVVRDPAGPGIIREYLPGRPVLDSRDPRDWELAGRGLARIHDGGYVLLDSNPGNFVVEDGVARLVDAEQAWKYTLEGGAWDLLVFTVYSVLFGVGEELVAEALKAYKDEAPERFLQLRRRALDSALSGRLRLMAYPVYRRARDLLLGV